MQQPDGPQEELMAPVAFGSTVTILFSDIRGFTEYTDAHGDEVAYRMLQHHNSLVQEQLALYGGHVVKTLGDSYMVSFEAARTAVTCAIAMQRALEQYNRSQQGPRIEIGVGIDTGEPVREAGDYFGGTVNRASRICGAAGAGRVLVSEVVRHVVGRMEGAEWIDRGFFEVKGFQEPQHLFEVDWSGTAAVRAAPVAPPPRMAPLATVPETSATPAPEARPAPPSWLVKYGAWAGVAAGILLLAGVAGGIAFFLGRGVAVPGEGETEAAVAPSLLFEDDFSDPSKGLFPDNASIFSSGGQKYSAKYESGQYVVRTEKKMANVGLTLPPLPDKVIATADFWAQVDAQALDPQSAKVPAYGFTLWPEKGKSGIRFLLAQPDQKWYRIGGGQVGVREQKSVAFVKSGTEVNKLRIEVRGQEIKFYVNDQLTEAYPLVNPPGAERVLGLRLWFPAEAEEETAIAFSRFMVGALEAAPAAPGPKLLFQDDPKDPAKRLFPTGEGSTPPPTLTFKRGYENDEYVVRASKGVDGSNIFLGNVRMSTDRPYAVEVKARAGGRVDKIRVGFRLWYDDDTRHGFQLRSQNGAWNIFYAGTSGPSSALAGNHQVTPLANKGAASNFMRLEVRDTELKVFLNGESLATVNHGELKKRPVKLEIGFWLAENLREGEGEALVAFSQFKVYALEEATATPLPPTPTPTAAAKALAPGDVLYEDDFKDPAKGLFPKQEGTTPGGLVFKRGYESGEYVVRMLKGPGGGGTYSGTATVSADYRYAMEAQARAEGRIDKIRYGIILHYGPPSSEHYGFQVTPSNGAWNVFYQPASGQAVNLAGNNAVTPFANQGPAANLLRLEVRGSELKVLINGQVLGTVTHEALKKRPVRLQTGIWARDLKEGEGEAVAAFSRFKVYYLGSP